MIKKIFTGLLVGVFFGIFVLLLGCGIVLGFGFSHAPWQFSPALGPLHIADFTFTKNNFEIAFHGGAVVFELSLYIIGALFFFLFQGLVRRRSQLSEFQS